MLNNLKANGPTSVASRWAWLRGFWRLIQPLRYTHITNLMQMPVLYSRYLFEWRSFRSLGGNATFELLSPSLFDRAADSQSGGSQYFYQDVWALNKLLEISPSEHHDVGSRIDGFVGQATSICPIIYYDIRQPQFRLPRLAFRMGSILNLPLCDQSVNSISCLHVAEHVGLGRYGDDLDPEGTTKALKELMRVLTPGGQLLLSMPVGRERVEFNAQRIWHPLRPIETLRKLTLKEFKAINDAGEFVQQISPEELADAKYSCGLYCFTRD